jgi:hypothetical protein
MFAGLWKELGEGFGRRWVLTVFGPALLFWGLSLFLYFEIRGWTEVLNWWESLVPAAQTWFVAGALAVVVFAAMLLEQLTTPIARLFEGYWPWPFHGLARRLSGRRREGLQAKQQRFSQLKVKEWRGQATPDERAEVARLEAELANRPPHPALSMPTPLGDVLRAAEEYPRLRYGLDPVVTWSRLYPSLSETLKAALAQARGNMDALLRVITLSLVFALVWGIWLAVAGEFLLAAAAVGGGAIVVLASYVGAVQAAAGYGDLLRAAFDLHRFDLYAALHWPLPERWTAEKPTPRGQTDTMGQALSQFLHRGMGIADVLYEHGRKENEKEK